MGAVVIVTVRLMPDSPDSNLEGISSAASERIREFGAVVGKTTFEPIAFGLRAVVIMFSMAEEKGSTEELEKMLAAIPQVTSVNVDDVRRAVG